MERQSHPRLSGEYLYPAYQPRRRPSRLFACRAVSATLQAERRLENISLVCGGRRGHGDQLRHRPEFPCDLQVVCGTKLRSRNDGKREP
jgi:hypothetical protein